MAAPVELVPKTARERDETQQSVVEFAEELLAQAKAGEITGIVLASRDTRGEWHHRLTVNLNVQQELGALFLLMLSRSSSILIGGNEDE